MSRPRPRALLLLGALLALLPGAPAAAGEMTILSFNICHAEGMDGKVDLARVAKVIRDVRPRFAALQELDTCAARSGYADEPLALARLTGYQPVFAAAIPFEYGDYGNLILAREQPLAVRKVPLPGVEPRVAVFADFGDCVFACTHLDLAATNRLSSARILADAVRSFRKPVFLCGDWNSMVDSPELAALRSFLTLLSETSTRTYHGKPANGPSGTTTDFCIDYIAVDTAHAARYELCAARTIDDRTTSDHAPICVTLKERP